MKKVEKETKKQLESAFSLWENIGKNKKEYLTGMDCNDHKLIGFYNTEKKNDREPDVKVYELNDKNEIGTNVASLWINESKDKKVKYLSGLTSDNEKIVAFYNDDTSNNKPLIRAYFKDEN